MNAGGRRVRQAGEHPLGEPRTIQISFSGDVHDAVGVGHLDALWKLPCQVGHRLQDVFLFNLERLGGLLGAPRHRFEIALDQPSVQALLEVRQVGHVAWTRPEHMRDSPSEVDHPTAALLR